VDLQRRKKEVKTRKVTLATRRQMNKETLLIKRATPKRVTVVISSILGTILWVGSDN